MVMIYDTYISPPNHYCPCTYAPITAVWLTQDFLRKLITGRISLY